MATVRTLQALTSATRADTCAIAGLKNETQASTGLLPCPIFSPHGLLGGYHVGRVDGRNAPVVDRSRLHLVNQSIR